MSDYNSSLPIRTETAGDVIAKIADATITSQQLAVGADGSINITDNGGSLTVDAVNLDIRDLAFATDKVDVSGSTNLGLDAATLAALESITVQNGAGASAVNIQDGGNSLTVDAVDLDIRNLSHSQDSIKIGDGTDFLAVNTDGSINVVVSNDVAGTEICVYNTSAALAAAASINFDYTVSGAVTMIIEQAYCSGSGKIKVELKVETAAASGTYNTKFVAFNSTANPDVIIPVSRYLKQVTGAKVRITITNRDNQAQDVYSTLTGSEA